ncbi:alpha/beta hydrolase fold domain-containing protein [Coraliomargarita sp. SDUM461004]|uniref:Alpha/beta hydrolase fold domain-containing protein n=1 Tax=Thalassobacterium sedimentorum TaxID=3041258 RepID=A0ABU1AME5_9BACT|nr:alpha/beta hydrolase fold domain-containing protein [Coraliomargarita sp. SDUM461004]MDQ8195980.1 alpha/beta hydrolase fold domain-containing protein [Coraliomargarita sp. SDUM461004]
MLKALILLILVCSWGHQLCARRADRIIEHREQVMADADSIVYKQGVWRKDGDELPYELRIIIVSPEHMQPSETYPAMIMVHGGGFSMGSPEQFLMQAHFFSKLGIVCFLPEYRLREPEKEKQRLTIPKVSIQEELTDIKRAVRWVKEHAATYQVDRERIIGFGGSAGGYLISAAGMVDLPDAYMEYQENESIPYENSKLNAQVLINPAVDLDYYFEEGYNGWRLSRDASASAMGMSPVWNITEETPATLLLNGSKDAVTPPFMVENFYARMQSIGKGEECQLVLFSGEGHGFGNRDPGLDRTMKLTANFLRQHGLTSERLDPLFDALNYSYPLHEQGTTTYSNFVHVLTPKDYSATRDEQYSAAVFLYEGPIVDGALCENDYYEMAELAKRFSEEKEVVTFVADFSLPYISRTSYDKSIKDVRSVFRWIKEHEDEFNINSSKILAVGVGYGAHLALSTTLKAQIYDHSGDNMSISPAPANFVLINPVLDLNDVRWNEEMFGQSKRFNYWAGGTQTIEDTDFSDTSVIDRPVCVIEAPGDPTYTYRNSKMIADESHSANSSHFYSQEPYLSSVVEQIFEGYSR